MNKRTGQCVSYYRYHRDTIMLVQIDSKPSPTTLVKVYMLISSAEAEEETEKVCEQIDELIKFVKRDENLVLLVLILLAMQLQVNERKGKWMENIDYVREMK